MDGDKLVGGEFSLTDGVLLARTLNLYTTCNDFFVIVRSDIPAHPFDLVRVTVASCYDVPVCSGVHQTWLPCSRFASAQRRVRTVQHV